MRRILVSGLALVFLSLVFLFSYSSAPAKPEGENQQLAQGKEIFNKNCTRCHPGGEAGIGPSLKKTNLAEFDMKFKARHSSGTMPQFSQMQLTDEQLDAVVAYVKTLKGGVKEVKEPKPVTDGKKECAGMETCQCCHEEVFARFQKTEMGALFVKHPRNAAETLGCESCHGPGADHANSEGKEFGGMIRYKKGAPTPVSRRNAACLQCHEKKQRLFWQGSAHDIKDVGCTECHVVHSGTESRFQLARLTVTDTCAPCHKKEIGEQMRFSHHPLREGKMDCSSCHNPHGTASEKLVKGLSTNELCYTCHAQYRGPTIFQHPPVTENCENCHQAHGSAYPRLLKTPQIRLCRDCHVNFHIGLGLNFGTAPGSPGRQRLSHVVGRACTDCHVNIHGSNSPDPFNGVRFLR